MGHGCICPNSDISFLSEFRSIYQIDDYIETELPRSQFYFEKFSPGFDCLIIVLCMVTEIHASGNSFGTIFRVTTFGESHGGGVGCIVDGCPPRLPLCEADIQGDLDRRYFSITIYFNHTHILI